MLTFKSQFTKTTNISSNSNGAENIPVCVPTIWADLSPTGLHKNNETCDREAETDGYTSDHILGRYTNYAPLEGGDSTDYSPSMSGARSPGLDGQHGKISAYSTTGTRVPGVPGELSLPTSGFPNRENEEDTTECPNPSAATAGLDKRHSQVCGESLSLSESNLAGSPPLKSLTVHDELGSSIRSSLHDEDEEAKTDLSWWTSLDRHSMMLSSLLPPVPAMTIQSDASNTGWGACQGEVRTGGMWSKEESLNHINYLELLAAFLALQCFAKQKCNITIQLKMDNLSAVTYINRMDGTHSQALCNLTISLWNWSL